MTKTKILLALILTVTGFVIGCNKEAGQSSTDQGNTPPTNSCEGVNAKFTTDIFPLVQTRCATGGGCHGSGSSNGPGEMNNFSQIKNAAINIKSAVESGRMPLGGSLSNTQIQLISCWVDSGSPDN